MNAFVHEPRKQFTPQQRAAVFASCGGRCHRCTRKIGPGEFWIVEHLIALENGGTNDDGNLGITCDHCIPEKNAEDHAAHGKGRRAYTKMVVPKAFRQSRGWGRR